MYSSNPNSYEKYSDPHGGPTTGIPVMSSSNTYMTSDHSSQLPVPAPPHHVRPRVQVPWSSGLYDCFSDIRNCCLTCWCPCITFGRIAEIVDKGSSSSGGHGALFTLIMCVTSCTCLYSGYYRSKMRKEFALREDPCGDYCVHFFCDSCALCQEYRELESRGFNMTIGWHENMEEKNREVAMAPVVEGGMTR